MLVKKNASKRPKLCIVSVTPLPIFFFLNDHIKELALTNDIFVITNASSDTYINLEGLPITLISINISRKINPLNDLCTLMILITILLKERFDLVWGVGPKAGFLSMIASKATMIKKRLFVFQGEVWASKKGLFRRLLKFCDSLTAKMATNLLAVSHAEVSFLICEGVIRDEQIQVIGSGSIAGVNIPKPIANYQLLRKKLGIPYDAIVILYVGRVHLDKGILDLAKAFKKLKLNHPKLHLLVVGPDEGAIDSLKMLLKGFDNFFHLYSFSSNVKIFYQAADIFCLPSYREGFPISLLEASSFELPVVASNIYGNKDAVIDKVTGLFFQVTSVEDLVFKLEKLLLSKKMRKTLGNNGLNMVKKYFDRNTVVSAYVKFINDLFIEKV